MPEATEQNLGGGLSGGPAIKPLTPEQIKQKAEAKRAEERQREEKRNADFDLTGSSETDESGQTVVSKGNPDGTGLVNTPVHKVSSESDVHQIENVQLKEEIKRKDIRIADLEGQIDVLNQTLQMTRDQAIPPEEFEQLKNMLAANPDRSGDFLVVIPNETFESTFGYKPTGSLTAKGEPMSVPNRMKFIKNRPVRVSRSVYEILKNANKLAGIQ